MTVGISAVASTALQIQLALTGLCFVAWQRHVIRNEAKTAVVPWHHESLREGHYEIRDFGANATFWMARMGALYTGFDLWQELSTL